MNGGGKNSLSFFKVPIPLLTLANLSLRCSLKLSFLSSLSRKCFWVCTFSSTTLLKWRLGWKDAWGFFEKTTSWACFVWLGYGLKFLVSTVSASITTISYWELKQILIVIQNRSVIKYVLNKLITPIRLINKFKYRILSELTKA